jgi:hypothetical protein
MGKIKEAAQGVREKVADTQLTAARSQNDTIRLWENYKDQAMMWRALSLIQLPTTFIAIIFALVMWSTREITLSVPSKPMPGMYAAQDIPDTEFVNVANDYVNLVATYQPNTARKQFEVARSMLKEPLLTKFNDENMNSELPAIETTLRTQVFFVDPLKTKVEREGNKVYVSISGERWKVIAGAPIPSVTSRYRLELTTIPRNPVNPYGIVITNILFNPNTRGERPGEGE